MITEPLDGSLFGQGQPCFGCGPDHPFGFQLAFVREGDAVITRFTPTERYQGPPGIMHGGLVMTLADEVAAWAILAKLGKFGFTASCESRFRAPVRIGTELTARGEVTKTSSRIVRTQVVVTQGELTCLTADVTFALLDQGGAEKMLQGPIPESWQRFCR